VGNSFRSDLKQAYDAEARQRDAGAVQDWKIKERAGFLALLQEEHKTILLEVGAGTGKDSRYFQDAGLAVTCIDLSPVMVDLCRQKGLNARVMDMTELSFRVKSFDAVYALNSLLHLDKKELPVVLRKINKVLKPEGLFFLGVYGGYAFEGINENDNCIPKRFFSFYGDDDLKQVVSQVFEIVYFQTISVENKAGLHFQSLILRKK
jgi:SAM-dependent methyltransferase